MTAVTAALVGAGYGRALMAAAPAIPSPLVMNLEEVRGLPAGALAAALDELRIGPGWATGALIRRAAVESPDRPCLPEPPLNRNQAFQNLVVGTMAERVFRRGYLADLERVGFLVTDYHEAGENRDFGVGKDGLELPINVKVASTMFRKALTVVGLDPEDCIPISAYKAIGASERVPELVYVDLVDFTLRERVDAFMDGLRGALAIGWHLLSWYRGKGAVKAQREYLRALFEHRGEELDALAPGAQSFRVISAQRVLAIMRANPRRVPGLGVRGAGTGGFVGEVNVHVSVQRETRSWDEVAAELRDRGISQVLASVMRTRPADIPDPLV
jgi:hypothetical protein